MISERIQNILRLVRDKVQRLMEVDRFYVALHDPLRAELEFPLVVDSDDLAETSRTPWTTRPYQGRALLPDRVIAQQAPLLFEHDLARRIEEAEVKYWPDDERPLSWLGAPMVVEDEVIGVLVTENRHKPRAFGEGKIRVLSTIARQTAMAIQNARLYERLARKIANLSAVNEVGRQLTSGIRLSEPEILELIYKQATPLMDTSDMYIALYEPDPEQPDEYNSENPELSVIHGTVRFGLAMDNRLRVDVEREKGWGARPADEKPGLTEYVIRTRRAHLPDDVKKAYKTYATEHIGKIPKSWMGVPMMVENKVLGVVVLRNDEYENVYSKDDLEVLQAIASQAAVAITNAGLHRDLKQRAKALEEANHKIAEREAVLVRSLIAEDFVHRLNNLAGTIPIWVDLIRQEIAQSESQTQEIAAYLNEIQRDTEGLLRAAEQLKYPPREQNVDVAFMLQSMLRQVRILHRDGVKTSGEIESELYRVSAVPSSLASALWNVISNGVEAILSEGEGTLTVNARNCEDRAGSKWVEVEFRDTGEGIPEENIDKIFTPFFTTKEAGRGYGLWRTKTVVESLEGSIRVESQTGAGATFTVVLPAVLREG